MAHVSEPRFLVLHGLRVKGFGVAATLEEHGGLPPGKAQQHLDELAADRLVSYRDGRISAWTLTGPGRDLHDELLARERAELGSMDSLRPLYEVFLELNVGFKQLCTRWQLRSQPDGSTLPNDHSDSEYDGHLIAQLREINTSVQPVGRGLTEIVVRFGAYGPRLTGALERLEAGDLDQFARPLSGSYHDVWMELHQDLLLTQAIDRAEEGST